MNVELIKPEEAAELLKVKLPTVYKWVDDGILPVVRIGKTVRFDKEALIDWLKKGGTSGRTT
jgi:excisionase family DNA binding protein